MTKTGKKAKLTVILVMRNKLKKLLRLLESCISYFYSDFIDPSKDLSKYEYLKLEDILLFTVGVIIGVTFAIKYW